MGLGVSFCDYIIPYFVIYHISFDELYDFRGRASKIPAGLRLMQTEKSNMENDRK